MEWSSSSVPRYTEQSVFILGAQSLALSVYCQYVQSAQPFGIGGFEEVLDGVARGEAACMPEIVLCSFLPGGVFAMQM